MCTDTVLQHIAAACGASFDGAAVGAAIGVAAYALIIVALITAVPSRSIEGVRPPSLDEERDR